MAFRRKAAYILAHKPDLLVVPECEHLTKLIFPPDLPAPTDSLWFGKNQNKGLGIFSYSNYRFRVLDVHDQNLQMIVPIAVSDGIFEFTLFAIWANNPADPDGPYVEQVWKAVKLYESLLKKTPAVWIGDFNSNTMWDRKRREGNHSTVVKLLAEKKIFSTYHLYHQQTQGSELHATHYLYRHQDKPYHLDYCFASKSMTDKLISVEIGEYDYWSKFSDHVPIIVSFDSSSGFGAKRRRRGALG